MVILVVLLFRTPIPLPGVSLPFGVVVALIGFRLALRQRSWLLERLLATELPQTFFLQFLGGTRQLVRGLEWLLRPRCVFLVDMGPLHHLYGVMIQVAAVLLLLPVPLPFSNGLPALTVVLLGVALLERDGYFVVAGMVLFAVALVWYGALVFGGIMAIEVVLKWAGPLWAGGTADGQ